MKKFTLKCLLVSIFLGVSFAGVAQPSMPSGIQPPAGLSGVAIHPQPGMVGPKNAPTASSAMPPSLPIPRGSGPVASTDAYKGAKVDIQTPLNKSKQETSVGASSSYGAIPVTPELEAALVSVNQKKEQAADAIDQRYREVTSKVKKELNEKGDTVIRASTRDSALDDQFDYYIYTTGGSFVEVSSSDISDSIRAGNAVQKNIYVYDAQTNTQKEITIYIDHSYAKGGMFARSDVPLSPEALEAAFGIAVNRHNVVPEYAFPPAD